MNIYHILALVTLWLSTPTYSMEIVPQHQTTDTAANAISGLYNQSFTLLTHYKQSHGSLTLLLHAMQKFYDTKNEHNVSTYTLFNFAHLKGAGQNFHATITPFHVALLFQKFDLHLQNNKLCILEQKNIENLQIKQNHHYLKVNIKKVGLDLTSKDINAYLPLQNKENLSIQNLESFVLLRNQIKALSSLNNEDAQQLADIYLQKIIKI